MAVIDGEWLSKEGLTYFWSKIKSIFTKQTETNVIANLGAKNILRFTAKTETVGGVTFTVNADGSVTEVTMKDEAIIVTTPNVATGDTGKSPLGYIMVIAGLVLLTVSIFARKKKEEPADDHAELCPDFIEGEED